VANRFRGKSVHKVDGKGRVSIPAPYRRVLEENDPDWTDGLNANFVLVYGGKSRDFLEGYSITAMNEVDENIADMKRGSKKRRILEHMFSGQSLQLQIDETGRLVLSQALRDKIGIGGEALFIASGDTFQIWQPEAYEQQAARYEEELEDLGGDFDPLILLDEGPEE
jgi:transcriptional regulator MraZ